jgi:hypothetical protein
MVADQWYIAREGQKVGPFMLSQIMQLAELGLLQPSEMLWTDGLSKWVEASAFPALFPRSGQKKFWLSIGGQPRGPYGADQLRASLTAQEITLDTLACPESGKDWQPLARMTEFRDFIAPIISPSQAKLLSGTLDVEEARLHLAGKEGDVIARLISTLMDLRKNYANNPGLAQSLDRSIKVLQARRDELTATSRK